jgi:thymidylate synthase (FAD)
MTTFVDKSIPVLDKGFIRVIDIMGNDSAIVQAARVSYGDGTKTINEDKGLINYLIKHQHTSPFEMCEIKLHIKLPIFIARQWIRHRTANVNEVSARYSVLPEEFYIPALENIKPQAQNNKQGRSGELDAAEAREIQAKILEHSKKSYSFYKELLGDENAEDGIARELARMSLPVNMYTEWYWKIDLHNLMHFVKLRIHPHAQYEIRVYAEALLEIIKEWCPFVYGAFVEHVLEAKKLSKTQIEAVKLALNGGVTLAQGSLSKREFEELKAIFTIQID